LKDIKEVAQIVTKTANYYQISVEEVLQWIKDCIIDVPNEYCFHYEVKKDN
jgi:hypothetical protein